jgi:hypothetical protein
LALLASFDTATNFGQILNRKGGASSGTLDNPFTENVVTIPSKPLQSATKLPKMPFGRFCAFGLQSPFYSKITAVNRFPVFLTQKLFGRGNGRTGQTNSYADYFTISGNRGGSKSLCVKFYRLVCCQP